MAGRPENMRPPRTKEEAKQRGRNGGIASGIARRRKRDMKDAAQLLLSMPVKFQSVADQMKNLGFAEEDLTNQMSILVSMYKEAMSGNVRAAEFLRDTIGTDAVGKERKERLRMEKERLKMEKERLALQTGNANGDGLPTIVNIRPGEEEANGE